MSIPVLQDQVILRPSDLQPSRADFKICGTFNPGVAQYQDKIILLVRVTEAPITDLPGIFTSPRAEWHEEGLELVTDTYNQDDIDANDPRVLRLPNGRVRLRYISHLRLARFDLERMQFTQIASLPELMPSEPWEEFGVEDARITRIGETYYITYVAISQQMGVATALMTTKDFHTFERHGIIFPTENKDVVFLPEKWQGSFVAYHRPVSNYWVDAPSVETSLSPDGYHWGQHKFLFGPREGAWDSARVGAGPPPIRLPQGWLLLYHGVSPATLESPVGRYCAGAVLLDGGNPTKLLARSGNPLICPDRPYEREGFAPNVIFPTGALLDEKKNRLLLFSGGADEVISLSVLSIDDLLTHIGDHDPK
jgi:predicted GH43/DUF377 family glycosyl hydrolase